MVVVDVDEGPIVVVDDGTDVDVDVAVDADVAVEVDVDVAGGAVFVGADVDEAGSFERSSARAVRSPRPVTATAMPTESTSAATTPTTASARWRASNRSIHRTHPDDRAPPA